VSFYQGRALDARRGRRGPAGRVRRALRVVAVLAALALIAHLPWETLRRRYAVVTEVRVEGLRYLDPASVARAAGLHEGQDLLALDLDRARQALLLQPRIARAEVTRRLPRGVRVRIEERAPMLLVRHGVPWEMDSAGTLLPPLAPGVVADVPLLAGPDFAGIPAGTRIHSPEVSRGLAWARTLDERALRLGGQVSEVDVSDPRRTALTLMNGTRVVSGAWPPGVRTLSALRVVLADLEQRGLQAEEVDLRYDNQVIVRGVAPVRGTAPASPKG
jgi:cell division septal protein FtsQ